MGFKTHWRFEEFSHYGETHYVHETHHDSGEYSTTFLGVYKPIAKLIAGLLWLNRKIKPLEWRYKGWEYNFYAWRSGRYLARIKKQSGSQWKRSNTHRLARWWKHFTRLMHL